MNSQIVKKKSSPTGFTGAIGANPPTLTCSGTFGDWQLTGGDGELLHMTTPIASGSAVYQGKTYSLAGTSVEIEIQLHYLPQPAPAGTSGTPNTPTADATPGGSVTQPTASSDPDSGKPKGSPGTPNALMADATKVVSVTQFNNPNDPTDPMIAVVNALTQAALNAWYNANLQAFNHTFVVVDLNRVADKADFQWLMPTSTGYACYNDDTTPANSLFGVLHMTENRTKPASGQISPNAIPAGAKAGFLIAPERFLEKLVLPGIHTIFDGSQASDFALANNNTQILNVNTVNLPAVDINGTNYVPTLAAGKVMLTIEETYIDFKLIDAVVDFSPGITIHMSYEAFTGLQLANQSNGNHTFMYYNVKPALIDHHVEVASWVTWAEVAASVAAALVTLGAGAWAKKVIERIALRVVAVIITLLVSELIANISAIIQAVAEGRKDDLPPVDPVIGNATDTVDWPGSSGFSLTSAALNRAFQIGGTTGIS